jgi:mono/diheme cytochrome c family protein
MFTLVVLLMMVLGMAAFAHADLLRVVKTGLGSGTITASGISCGNDCEETYASTASVILMAAVVGTESTFAGWAGDCAFAGMAATCTLTMNVAHSARAQFNLNFAIPQLTNFTPAGIATYLMTNSRVTTPARFLSALPDEFKQNWILMSRSESLQTGTAQSPRILLPSANAQQVFTIGMMEHSSYPGAHPNAIEYMQWDPMQRNFRFHEIVLDTIGAMNPVPGSMPPDYRIPARSRGVSVDDSKCFACHSTRNVLNRGSTPGTDRVPPGLPPTTVMFKNKPNWDSYDSWGGMLPFNRDRVYQGSVEAAALRRLLNLYTWSTNDGARSIIEQLTLQPAGIPAGDAITRTTTGGANDGHINFAFDVSPPVLKEPSITGTQPSITTTYAFNGAAGTGTGTSVVRGGTFAMLHHPTAPYTDGEGRGVDLFDRLGGLDDRLNAERIGDEIAKHRVATGNVLFDVRPLALAIAMRCITVSNGPVIGNTQTIASNPALSAASTTALAFFNSRHGLTDFNQLYDDTRRRSWDLTRRKADIQKLNLDRTNDPYIYDDFVPPAPDFTGLLQLYGGATAGGVSTMIERIRQEVFRRHIDLGHPDTTVMSDSTVTRDTYVDREDDGSFGPDNTEPVALFRYFLEPLGVSVDKWSMGVRGRSRTYTFADVFTTYRNGIAELVRASLISDPNPNLPPAMLTGSAAECNALIPAVDALVAALPPADGPDAIPTYTDIQRIFNKSCIECHGGLGYPPYSTFGTSLNFAEDEEPAPGARRLQRPYNMAMSRTNAPMGTDVSNSPLYQRITNNGSFTLPYNQPGSNESCPGFLMPCGGPPLSKVDIETVRRWIIGGRPYTEGDPHIRTVDGVDYDFQSAGEFVLLRDENLEIQARQTAVTTAGPLGPNAHTGLSSCVSVNTAVALRVGAHRLSYQPTIRLVGVGPGDQPGANRLVLRIDGRPVDMTGREIALPSGGRIVRTSAADGIQVEYPGGTVVVITPAFWTHHQIWYMNIDVRHARATEGVMGAISPGNWLPALPDGRLLGPRPANGSQRYQDLYETFADAWRVTSGTSLFEYEPGLSTDAFTVDTWPMESPKSCTAPPQPGGPQGTTLLATIPQAEAEKLCSALAAANRKANCVLDLMATGERGFVETYMRTQRIDDHLPPSSPVLRSPANDLELTMADTLTFNWTRAVASGGPVTYRHCIWNGNQIYDLNNCGIVGIDRPGAVLYPGALGLIALLLFLVLLFVAFKHKRVVLGLVAIVILASVLAALYARLTAPLSATVSRLQPGKVYFWRVIAEDGEGGFVESPTRRFLVR